MSPELETVAELGPESVGRWIVETQGSFHIWDLDNFTVIRIPGPDSHAGPFAYDSQPMAITRVTYWPRVGFSSLIWFDDPENPLLEHYRLSSTVRRIHRDPSGHEPASPLEALFGPCWSERQVCYQLDLLDLEQLEQLRVAGQVLGVQATGDHRVYPASQFATYGNTVGVKPALNRLFRALRGFGSWRVAVLAHIIPAPELEGMTPLAWADAELSEAAIDDLIRRVVSEWR